jgi:hypothetical protein
MQHRIPGGQGHRPKCAADQHEEHRRRWIGVGRVQAEHLASLGR